ncbi:MAG TPA: CsoR family transcriptional regulator [Lachnospiraceae bacterium]|jgi:DNA-binding FrmR family transcriptional regulator|nr:CsoR family transcriptional regulator [Lachnospiraceae bacterium]
MNEEKIETEVKQAEQETVKECPCCDRSTQRSDEEVKDLIRRLNRIEGQVRGIRRMVENDAYCVDILTQVQATSCALNSFTKQVLSRHIKTCVADDIREGGEEKVDELVNLLQRLMK